MGEKTLEVMPVASGRILLSTGEEIAVANRACIYIQRILGGPKRFKVTSGNVKDAFDVLTLVDYNRIFVMYESKKESLVRLCTDTFTKVFGDIPNVISIHHVKR